MKDLHSNVAVVRASLIARLLCGPASTLELAPDELRADVLTDLCLDGLVLLSVDGLQASLEPNVTSYALDRLWGVVAQAS